MDNPQPGLKRCPVFGRECLGESCPLAHILKVEGCPLEVFSRMTETVMKDLARELDDSLDDGTKKAILDLLGLSKK